MSLQSDGIPENHVFYRCDSSDNSGRISTAVSFAYKFLLQLIAVYFAFRTRNVEIEVLNDSRQTTAIVYLTSLILIVTTAFLFTTDTRPNLFGAVVGIAIIVYPTVILGFTFIPKVRGMYMPCEHAWQLACACMHATKYRDPGAIHNTSLTSSSL